MVPLVLLAGVAVLFGLALAVFPPRRPHWWRRRTRPLRRVLRPSHYRW